MKFTTYDYRARKEKVEEILDGTDEVKEVRKFPSDKEFTYTNAYKSWASAIFVDLRDSTALFSEKNDVDIAKVIRGFTSEIIEILRKDDDNDMKEIGIRGDCVYAIYSTATQEDIYDVGYRACYVNTYMKMLNRLLEDRGLPTIKAGIGLSARKTLAVKAGRKSSGINNLVWIGKSVARAAKLSDKGNKDGVKPIVMCDVFYSNYIKILKGKYPEKDAEKWFTKEHDSSYGTYYYSDLIIDNFNDWIVNGMRD